MSDILSQVWTMASNNPDEVIGAVVALVSTPFLVKLQLALSK